MSRPPEKMHPDLVEQGEAAIAKHERRKFVPNVIEGENGWRSPFAPEHDDQWWALFFDLFGTRLGDFVTGAFNTLSPLPPQCGDPRQNIAPTA